MTWVCGHASRDDPAVSATGLADPSGGSSAPEHVDVNCSTIVPAKRLPPGLTGGKIGTMIAPASPTKITFADMRDMGVRGLLIGCSDYRRSRRWRSAERMRST